MTKKFIFITHVNRLLKSYVKVTLIKVYLIQINMLRFYISVVAWVVIEKT